MTMVRSSGNLKYSTGLAALPVLGQVKANRRIDRVKCRGLAAARSEWRLSTATRNLLKLHRHTLHPAAA